jgi:polyisoprenoid-binding protein YceI
MAWQIDSAHSEVQFAVRHLMISTVRGQFEKFSGTVDLNEANPTLSSVDVQIDAASITTRNEQRDGHLRSPDFLSVDQYPTITFKSKRVEQIDANNGRIIGDLTIRDITNEVSLEVEYSGQAKTPWGTTSAGFSAHTKINRSDWNLIWNQTLETGGVLVSEEIKISIEVEVVQQADQAAQAEEATASA